jgi:predicted GNAT superfamily acetyltransferase
MTPAKKKISSRASKIQSIASASDGIVIRHCHGLHEFELCIQVERAVWQSSDIDVVPSPLFVVASEIGGQVLGAFDGDALVGFTLALVGWRDRKPFLHSHMTAVVDACRDRKIGQRLKLFQRKDALSRGIDLIEWTFDPLVARNAHFNFMRLGAIARRYLPNIYGITTSPLHASLPTDRLVAEWHLRSPRVAQALSKKRSAVPASKNTVRVKVPREIEDLKQLNPERAIKIQAEVRETFATWFAKGYVATAVMPVDGGMEYILERRSAK